MGVTERPYRDEDLSAVCAALSDWRRTAGALGYCHPGEVPHRIYENLRGRYPLGEVVRIWEDDGTIVGFAICCRFEWSFDAFVAPALRGTTREVDMLRTAMTITGSRLPATEDAPEVNSDVYGGDSTRIAALERLGFAYSQKWDDLTERSLATPIPAVALPAGFAIRSATRSDAAELAAARNGAFGDSWTPESYRDEVMLKPGYDLSRELVAVTPEGRVASFAVIWLDDLTRVGHFEPVGTAPDFHNRGLAKAVMTEGLTRLRAAGMLTATVEYDATNQSAAIFYARLLFRRFSETHGFVRQFPASDSLPASH